MKYKINYEAPPISEVVKTCTIETYDDEDLTAFQASEGVNSMRKVLGQPLITEADIISIKEIAL